MSRAVSRGWRNRAGCHSLTPALISVREGCASLTPRPKPAGVLSNTPLRGAEQGTALSRVREGCIALTPALSQRERGRFGRVRSRGSGGFTLFEVLIAMILMAMVAVMIYSVLNVGIKFTDQGGRKILAMERKYAFLTLVQRQVISAVYDGTQRRILMSADDDIFKVVTRYPFVYPEAGVVLAIYRYSAADKAIYYTEKRDYYNTDYGDDYVPDFKDMTVLAWDEGPFSVKYDADKSPEVLFTYRGQEYSLVPKCADRDALSKLKL
jgi:prepilin-type N-terminal cleavage/methylation domain-containing protein